MIATVLLVAIVVVLAAVVFVLVENYLGSGASTPALGEALALPTPSDAVGKTSSISACSTTPCNFYNMTVQSAASGMELKDLTFQILGPGGNVVIPTGGLVALNVTGVVIASFTLGSGWVSGGTMLVQSHLTMVLYTSGPSPQSLAGDTLRVLGVAKYSGSISLTII
ncbi:MAG: hypothetical protein L3K14_07100 [Thermoplasmata archaeon]|nr:hypothetical protein [Thermoplasmata archaeon]